MRNLYHTLITQGASRRSPRCGRTRSGGVRRLRRDHRLCWTTVRSWPTTGAMTESR